MSVAGALVWDNHGCLPLSTDPAGFESLDLYRSAGIDIVSVNIGFGRMAWDEHVAIAEALRTWIAARPERFRLVATADDVEACRAAGALGIIFDVEGMGPVLADPSRVETLYALGVRWMLIAYNRSNAAGGGCLDADSGLTARGRAIIDAMERAGMILCLSHAGPRTAAEALDHATRPAIFSHSNPAAHVPHPRNVADPLLRACAAKGGVIGLSGIGDFLGGNDHIVARYIDQLRYLVDLVGPRHVGFGLDYVFDPGEIDRLAARDADLFPAGMMSGATLGLVSPFAVVDIAEALARDNMREEDIQGVLGGNWLRLARELWR